MAEVNRVNAEVSSSLSAETLENIPVEGRNFTQALYRLPNVTLPTGFFPEAPNVRINGANGLFGTGRSGPVSEHDLPVWGGVRHNP